MGPSMAGSMSMSMSMGMGVGVGMGAPPPHPAPSSHTGAFRGLDAKPLVSSSAAPAPADSFSNLCKDLLAPAANKK